MASIETRASWVVAFTALGIMSIAYGAPFVAVVALKEIAGELGSARSVPAAANSLAWLGAAVGGKPGPIVSHFTSGDMAMLPVPLMIIPGSLDREAIDRLS